MPCECRTARNERRFLIGARQSVAIVLLMLSISWTDYGRLHAGSWREVRYWVLAVHFVHR